MHAHTHVKTELKAKAELYLQRCGKQEWQAHYAVGDILYHWLTFIMLNLPQTPSQPACATNAKQPLLVHHHSHVYRQRLMGKEQCAFVQPCIERTSSWRVQEEECLPSDTFTTRQGDLLLLRSGGGGRLPHEKTWKSEWSGLSEISKSIGKGIKVGKPGWGMKGTYLFNAVLLSGGTSLQVWKLSWTSVQLLSINILNIYLFFTYFWVDQWINKI